MIRTLISSVLFAVAFLLVSCVKDSKEGGGSVRVENVEIEFTVNGAERYTLTQSDQTLEYETVITIPSGTIEWKSPTIEQTFHETLEVNQEDVNISDANGNKVSTTNIVVENGRVRATFLSDVGGLEYLSSGSFTMTVNAVIKDDVTDSDLEALAVDGIGADCRFYSEGRSSLTKTATVYPVLGAMEGVGITSSINGHSEFTMTEINTPLLFSTNLVTNDKTSQWTAPTFEQTFDDVLKISTENVTITPQDLAVSPEISIDGNKLTVSFVSDESSYDYLNSETITIEVNASIKEGITGDDLAQFTTKGLKAVSKFYATIPELSAISFVEVRTHLSQSPILVDYVMIPVVGATAQYQNPGHPIENSIDGHYDTYFGAGSDNGAEFPLEVIYEFEDVPAIEKFIHYPTGNLYGFLQQFEVWYTTKSNPDEFVKYGDFDFNGSAVSRVGEFSPALVEPVKVKFILGKGYQNINSEIDYVSIGELEFYKKNPDKFDYSSIFTDPSCSEFKPGVTESMIESIVDPFYKDLATKMFNNEYNTEFRTQSYKAWQNPTVMANQNKTSGYSLLDNPTGIFVDEGVQMYVLVGDIPTGVRLSLRSKDVSFGYREGEVSYPVTTGLNMFETTAEGLLYVTYHTDTGTEAPVNINIVTGEVNGYFDTQKHTEADWTRLLDAAGASPHFDALGEYSHAIFPVASYKQYATEGGTALMKRFDDLVYYEQQFMGLEKYDKMFKNRMLFRASNAVGYMWAGYYETGYPDSAMYILCGFATATDVWGPAHEVGHVNQTSPGFNWYGMGEVSNNVFSLYIQERFGITIRFYEGGREGDDSRSDYNKWALNPVSGSIIGDGRAHVNGGDLFEKLMPFWQLYLYLVKAQSLDDFYKDLYEYYRITPNLDTGNGLTQGVLQLDFVRQTCRLANLDLTDFFTTWGFLRPVEIKEKVGTPEEKAVFLITQQQVDDLKAEIAVYPKPAHSNIHHITDETVANFK